MFVDTHCHIHSIGSSSDDYTVKKWQNGKINNPDTVVENALAAGVNKLICVGTDLEDSRQAVNFVKSRPNCWASVGLHPHDAADFTQKYTQSDFIKLLEGNLDEKKIVAIGECGLDYFYEHSPKATQREMLEMQLDAALKYNLPVIFHVRDAHEDFWPILDNFSSTQTIRGVLHSFSATGSELEQGLKRGLFIGLNGIMTFTKDESQLEAAKQVPLDRLLIETDAPYLTPTPVRGKICKPEHVKLIAKFLCDLRGEEFELFASQTTKNAEELFNLG